MTSGQIIASTIVILLVLGLLFWIVIAQHNPASQPLPTESPVLSTEPLATTTPSPTPTPTPSPLTSDQMNMTDLAAESTTVTNIDPQFTTSLTTLDAQTKGL
ncbi:MAG TPA: hypothetical protein VLG69_05305 [Candidatus Andersenbacteria bacterium]|nr:hypothetical protein [Candidatus Andersenbacteria bacterium]